MLVLADADLERAANFATYYSMQNAGQTCISIERVYVEEPVYDEFVAKVSEKVRALRVGKPDGFGSVEVGAITFPPQLDTIEDTSRTPCRRARACSPAVASSPAPGASMSRPCSSTSTTR